MKKMCEMNSDKKCSNCKYFDWDDLGRAHVCVNDASEHIADFVSETDSCEKHEKTMKVLKIENLRNWFEEYKEGVLANKEVYSDAQDILDLVELLEEYVDANSENIDDVIKEM